MLCALRQLSVSVSDHVDVMSIESIGPTLLLAVVLCDAE